MAKCLVLVVHDDAEEGFGTALSVVAGAQEQALGSDWTGLTVGDRLVASREFEDFDPQQALSSLGSVPWSDPGKVCLLYREDGQATFSEIHVPA